MKKVLLVMCWIVSGANYNTYGGDVEFVALEVANTVQRNINFNRDWRFTKGEQPRQVRQIDFDDSNWQNVRLPHDWAISGPFNEEKDGKSGKLPWKGIGWYRKTFQLDRADAGRRVYFDFNGVMAFPKIYVKRIPNDGT